jgi:Spy/CpxP family protein refolding chaperone
MAPRWSRLALAAIALPLALPLVAAQAQTQSPPPFQADGLSPEVRGRLFDGRMAMIRESLKLTDAQQKLWAPVEQELRAAREARLKAFAEHKTRAGDNERLTPSERLDRASKHAAARAEHVKALADAFRPFYASLSDEQKAVATVVLRPILGGGRGFKGRRWAMGNTPMEHQQ